MYTLLCTSYNDTKGGLVLRDNWFEPIKDDKDLLEFFERFEINTDFKYLSRGEMSNILTGRMQDVENVVLHVRIIRK